MSSKINEIERRSISACSFVSLELPDAWTDEIKEGESVERAMTGIGTEDGISVRISPMSHDGWKREHFHPDLCAQSSNFAVRWQSRARECVLVALSPEPEFVLGKTYAAHLGAAGNLTTVIRRRPDNESSTSTVRVCSESKYTWHWLAFCSPGKVLVGNGPVPGKKCIAILEDMLYHSIRPGQDRVRYIGFGNSSLNRRARDLWVRNILVFELPDSFDAAPSEDAMRDVEVGDVPNADLLHLYREECEKAKARAIKFKTGITKPIKPDTFLKWSEAQRLLANPERGFITGIDITSPEEELKRRQRRERFKNKRKKSLDDDENDCNDVSDDMVEDVMQKVIENDPTDQEIPSSCLPIEQAWDNIKQIRQYRIDPHINSDSKDMVGNECVEVPEKLHLFAIDWAAFKQLRSDDVMACFKMYGPSYVEWLGELSLNIHFEDKFSAIRAMNALSQEIGAIENGLEDLGALGWRFCCTPVVKISNDRFGRKGTRSRYLLRTATSIDVLENRPAERPVPPGYTTKKILGPKKKRPRRSESEHRMSIDVEEVLNQGLKSKRK